MRITHTFEQAKQAFGEIAEEHYIGDPNGKNAYCYIRVSTEEQSDSKRSGLARQIIHCHEVAKQNGYRIRWDWVYADDSSGFTFEERTGLTRLRNEIQNPHRQAQALIIENLDRLSRNADWHQGYLLDEFRRHGIKIVFWTSYSSRVERAVMGAVAQDAMELAKKRMYEGQRAKARSGRVTARRAAYGYKLVDSDGNEGPHARKDTHYAIYEVQAQVVRRIYKELASGKALRAIARELTGFYPTPTGKHTWGKSTVKTIIENPNYKGEFHAFRWSKDRQGKHIEYDDYIVVPVPAIVSESLWNAANAMLKKNKQTASRNGKQEYLLTGLVKCAECGYAYVGHRANTRSAPRKRSTQRKSPLIVYRCSSHHDLRYQQSIYCSQGKIGSKKLESAVWSLICRVLLDPELVAEAVDRYFLDESNAGPLAQMQYLEEQICNREQENERIYKAYIVGAFDEHEFSARTHEVKARIANLKTEIATLRTRVMSINDAELKKRMLREIAKEAKLSDLADTLPFQKKKQIIKMVVERIELNQKEKWFTMTGVISGTHSFAQITNETTTSSEDGLVTKGEAIAMNVSANPENFSILDSSKQIPALAPVRYVSLGLSQ